MVDPRETVRLMENLYRVSLLHVPAGIKEAGAAGQIGRRLLSTLASARPTPAVLSNPIRPMMPGMAPTPPSVGALARNFVQGPPLPPPPVAPPGPVRRHLRSWAGIPEGQTFANRPVRSVGTAAVTPIWYPFLPTQRFPRATTAFKWGGRGVTAYGVGNSLYRAWQAPEAVANAIVGPEAPRPVREAVTTGLTNAGVRTATSPGAIATAVRGQVPRAAWWAATSPSAPARAVRQFGTEAALQTAGHNIHTDHVTSPVRTALRDAWTSMTPIGLAANLGRYRISQAEPPNYAGIARQAFSDQIAPSIRAGAPGLVDAASRISELPPGTIPLIAGATSALRK